MAGVDAEPLRELPVRELRLGLLAEHLQHSHPEGVSERFQLLGFVEYQCVLHGLPRPQFYI